MKLSIIQIADGVPTIVSEWSDNEKGAIVSFHQTCANLYNDANTEKAIVKIVDENFNTYIGNEDGTFREYGGFEEVIDKTREEITSKISVVAEINGNLDVNGLTEWTNRKGAMVKFHQKAAALWNTDEPVIATLKIFDDKLNLWESNSETIIHDIVKSGI